MLTVDPSHREEEGDRGGGEEPAEARPPQGRPQGDGTDPVEPEHVLAGVHHHPAGKLGGGPDVHGHGRGHVNGEDQRGPEGPREPAGGEGGEEGEVNRRHRHGHRRQLARRQLGNAGRARHRRQREDQPYGQRSQHEPVEGLLGEDVDLRLVGERCGSVLASAGTAQRRCDRQGSHCGEVTGRRPQPAPTNSRVVRAPRARSPSAADWTR
jgi:hypothetical protein